MGQTRFPFDYRVRTPDPPLGLYVAFLWYARGTVPYRRERIAPTGSTVAVFVLGEAIIETADDGRGERVNTDRGFLLGPHDRPVVNEPTGETYAVGVVTTSVGCEAVFALPPTDIAGRVTDLLSAWPPAAEIRRRLLALDEPVAMLEALEEALRSHFRELDVERCRRAIDLLEADPLMPIADIAEALGVSHGHLDREFTRVVGLTPRVLGRLLRMQRLLARIEVSGDVSWKDRAVELGWYDQAHLIRDFKRHTGVTPSQYVRAQRDAYGRVDPGEGAGFVPEA